MPITEHVIIVAYAPIKSRGIEKNYFIGYIFPVMDDWQTIRKAAEQAGVARNSVARWVRMGLLRGVPTKVGHIQGTLVSISQVKRLAKTRKPGRPKSRPEK